MPHWRRDPRVANSNKGNREAEAVIGETTVSVRDNAHGVDITRAVGICAHRI